MAKHRYSEEERDFLRENASKHTYAELVDIFAQRFGRQVSCSGLQQFCSKVLGVKAHNPYHHIYTYEEKAWLMEHINDGNHEEVTAMFNAMFGVNVKAHSIKDECTKVLKIKKAENIGQFREGGEVKSVTHPIGTEIKRNGYWVVKVDDKYHKGKYTHRNMRENWKLKQVHVYEQAYGKIPDGSFVVFLDSDRENFDLKNLYCTDRRILSVMNYNKWFTEDPELTLAAIKWCELHYAIKEVCR